MADDEVIESTFQGYISSTHDALLVFEAVRRGMMPKIPRRLRENERGLLRSGNIFVFDEKQSNIKRWTDGMLWSPSRILSNFLIYRQVHRKSGKAEASQDGDLHSAPVSVSGLAAGAPFMIDAQQDLPRRASEGLLLEAGQRFSFPNDALYRARSGSFIAEQEAPWSSFPGEGSASIVTSTSINAAGLVAASSHTSDGNESSPLSELWPKGFSSTSEDMKDYDPDNHLERSLVGSLTSTYLFVKGGLCKKTISLSVDNSTHHLISYYSVEDVRAGRLRTPSSLPEIRSLAISPVFLNPSNFRDPPNVEVGQDGVPRFRLDASDGRSSRSGTNSGGDSAASGSDTRSNHRPGPLRTTDIAAGGPYSPPYHTDSSSPASVMMRPAHTNSGTSSSHEQLPGTSISRRMSDAPLRSRATSTASRYEPYPLTWSATSQRISRPGSPNRSSFESMSGSSRASDRTGATSPSAAPAASTSLGSHLSSWSAPARGHTASDSGHHVRSNIDGSVMYGNNDYVDHGAMAASSASSSRDHFGTRWSGTYSQGQPGHHELAHSLSNDHFPCASLPGWSLQSQSEPSTAVHASPATSALISSQSPQLHGSRSAPNWQGANKAGNLGEIPTAAAYAPSFASASDRSATAHTSSQRAIAKGVTKSYEIHPGHSSSGRQPHDGSIPLWHDFGDSKSNLPALGGRQGSRAQDPAESESDSARDGIQQVVLKRMQ